MSVDVSVIIVSWNTRDLLAQCLSSLFDADDGLGLEVIVVDNASQDDSVEYVAEHFGQVKIIANETNNRQAIAWNQGLEIATGRNVLLLDSDTIVHKGALKSMVDLLDNTPDAGFCSCQLLNSDGTTQSTVSNLPCFGAMLQRYTIFKHLGLFKSARDHYKRRDFPYDEVASVEFITGAVSMVKRDVLNQIGNIDGNIYFYFEDTDLCHRIKEAGYKIYFTPHGQITHLSGASSSPLGLHRTEAMFYRSMLYYFRKHKGRGKTFVFSLLFKPGVYLNMFCEAVFGFFGGVVHWCLRRDSKRLVRSKECALFLAKYGVRFLFY